MVNEEYKFIHIHIKKTGGRSLAEMFPDCDQQHHTFLCFYQMLGESIKDYFVWTTVRNSWDRMVSLFFYHTQIAKNCHTDSFKKFIADMYDGVMNNTYDNFYDSGSQVEYLLDGADQVAVDYVALLANIDRDFEMICKRLGLPSGMRYQHANASNHGDYRDYYDEETKRRVSELQAKDIEWGGFAFEDKSAFKYPVPDCIKEPMQQAWRDRVGIFF